MFGLYPIILRSVLVDISYPIVTNMQLIDALLLRLFVSRRCLIVRSRGGKADGPKDANDALRAGCDLMKIIRI